NQPWSMASNSRNISLELSRQNKVLYVCPPLDRKMLLTKKHDPYVKKVKGVIDGSEKAVEMVALNTWVFYPDFIAESINWIPIPAIHDFLNRWNNQKFAERIKKVLKDLGFDRHIIFN